MNVLVTINKKYLEKMHVMITSLLDNCKENVDIYVLANDVKEKDLSKLKIKENGKFHLIHYTNETLDNAPTTKRYPSVIYYRLLAASFLPSSLDRVLYLDPDIIVLKDLSNLYNTRFYSSYFIGSSNVKRFLSKFNELKNKAPKKSPYLNTGVLLINLKALRKENVDKKIYEYLIKHKNLLTLPDQDILQGLYGDKVKLIDNLKYNLSDRTINLYNLVHTNKKIDLSWVEKNCYIIHYFGRNKPWNDSYKGILKQYYLKYLKEVKKYES